MMHAQFYHCGVIIRSLKGENMDNHGGLNIIYLL